MRQYIYGTQWVQHLYTAHHYPICNVCGWCMCAICVGSRPFSAHLAVDQALELEQAVGKPCRHKAECGLRGRSAFQVSLMVSSIDSTEPV